MCQALTWLRNQDMEYLYKNINVSEEGWSKWNSADYLSGEI